MKRFATPDGVLSLALIALAIVALVLWVPQDIETGLIEKVRRQIRIGDAMLPAVALGFVILGGVMALVSPQQDAPRLSADNVVFLMKLLACLALALLIMRWLGPLTVAALGGDSDYRVLRDTAPWKYVGFLIGGTVMVAGLMALTQGRLTWRGVLTGFLASLALIALYDLPFEDLLLPPNGDV